MTGRSLVATLALAALGLVTAPAGRAVARRSHCRRDCKVTVADCLALVPSNQACVGSKGEKKACRKAHAETRRACHHLVRDCRELNPDGVGTCLATTTTTVAGTPTCGIFVPAWGAPGSGNGQVDHSIAVATDAGCHVFVGEGLFGGRIQKFDSAGALVGAWGAFGTGNGRFSGPTAVETDASA
jgi:hypothetical protein